MSINRDKQGSVAQYRRLHRRCRTCRYASDGMYFWVCQAKNARHSGRVCDTVLAGCTCRLYRPNVIEEEDE